MSEYHVQLKDPINLKSKICERLKLARIAAGFSTAKEFALKRGLKISTYNLHEAGTRGMALDVIEQYADLLNLNINWLLTGDGPKNITQVRNVPIIDWQEALHYPKHIDFSSKKLTSSDIDLSPLSFALIVDNNAMEPRYPEGTIIIIDVELTPKIKDFALISTKDKKVPIFKQIVQVDGNLYAKSLNPSYKPIKITKNDQMMGKVVQAKLMC
jgi:phage repressor protein C with HTH and peptisase S24 domain